MKSSSPTAAPAAVPTAQLDWDASRRKLIEAGGRATQSFGLGRTFGQVYALLYLSPAPLCLDDIVRELGVSKASVSTTVRQLAAWSAVRSVWVKGDRKDYYEVETDFRAVFRSGLLDTIRKKLNTAGMQFDAVLESLERAAAQPNGKGRQETLVISERLKRARQLHRKVDALLTNPLIEHLI